MSAVSVYQKSILKMDLDGISLCLAEVKIHAKPIGCGASQNNKGPPLVRAALNIQRQYEQIKWRCSPPWRCSARV